MARLTLVPKKAGAQRVKLEPEQAVARYLESKAENTRRSYSAVLRQFSDLTGVVAWRATNAHALEYLGQLKRKKQSIGTTASTTLCHHMAFLSGLTDYLIKLDVRKDNPFKSVEDCLPVPSAVKRPTKAFHAEDFAVALRSISGDGKAAVRDRAILALLFGAALRRDELLRLDVADCAEENGVWVITLRQTKNHDQARIPLAPWAGEYLAALYHQRMAENLTEPARLCINYGRDGEPLGGVTESTLYRRFKRLLKKAGIEPLGCHAARATAITQLLSSGCPIDRVKDFSRHKSLQMVLVYDRRLKSVTENPALTLEYPGVTARKK